MFENYQLKSLLSPLVYILIIFVLLDNYFYAVFEFKTKIDEVILIILNLMFFLHLANEIFVKKKILKIELPLIFFFIALVMSSLLNYESGLVQKGLGSYYLIKSLNVFFLIYSFGISRKYLHKILNLIIYFALLSVVVQLIQFLFPNINTLSFGYIPEPYVTSNFIRCNGLLGAENRTAQLFILAYVANRLLGNGILNYRTLTFLLGLLLAASNTNLFLFLLVITLDLIRNNKKLILPFGSIVFIGLLYAGESYLFRLGQLYELAYINESYFRLFAYINSLEVLENNLFLGVGPGMYGGSVSAIMGSPIHDQYNTFSYYGASLHIPTTIDMFWPHFWAEVGIIGLLLFLVIFINILRVNIKNNNKKLYFINILIISFLILGVSTFSLESTFASVIVYTILGGYMYWSRKNDIF